MLKAILWPLPISPRTFSTGTLQSSKISGVVELPRMPSLCSSRPWVNPGVPRSTIIAVNRVPSILRKTTYTSAKPPFVIHIFPPLTT